MGVETVIECLCCGQQRPYTACSGRHPEPGECQRCRYVGWAFVEDVSESLRRGLRDRPLQYRHLRAVHQA